MNIKSLLLGSAAALIATSGANAADSVVSVASEPVEYVRVCDAYGAGYFYIPGTETCMRLSGYVRSDLKGGDNTSARLSGAINRDTYSWRTRAALRFHTASETELGTLRTFVELRSDWKRGAESDKEASETQLRFAYIELGGLRVGLDESIFNHWTGYFGSVINDDVITRLAYSRTNVISYTYNAGNGFSAILGLEQGNTAGDSGGYSYNADYTTNMGYNAVYSTFGQQIVDYTPNVIGGLKFAQGWGALSGVAAFDARNKEWAGKIRADVNVTDEFSVWLMGGYKSMDDRYAADTTYGIGDLSSTYNASGALASKTLGVYRQINSIYGDWGGHWAVWGGGKYKFTPSTSLNVQMSYDASRTFATSVNVSHQIVPGLSITPELTYVKWNNNYGFNSKDVDGSIYTGVRDSLKGQNALQGMVRLQRSF